MTSAKKKAVVFSYGRLNPPTIGHENLVNRMLELAKLGNADSILFLSQHQHYDDNPIAYEDKHRIVTAAFPQIEISNDRTAVTPFDALRILSMQYEDIVMMVGEDRVELFQERMAPYAKNSWGVKNFIVMSAGARNPKSRGVAGASATKMRGWARLGKKEEFFAALPNRLNSKMKNEVYQLTVKGLVRPVPRRKA